MIFSSFSFLYLFLPTVWIVYWLARSRSADGAMLFLTLASLFFYGYWDIRFLPLLLGSIVTNHLIAGRLQDGLARGRTRSWLIAGITFNLGLPAFFKYANFFSDAVHYFTGYEPVPFAILLPIGISFFTFQQITYLIDISKGKAQRYSLQRYTLFVAFFPQLIAGPIVHHSEMMPQFLSKPRLDWLYVAAGLGMFTVGLFKKLVLADNISPFTIAVFAATDAGQAVTFAEVWAALIAFSFQMYFDFSGYCDMAIGLGLMFGIRLPINFNSPYKSRTIAEHWRRWNITLGRFLRDYVYLPLGGSALGETRQLINLMIVMTLSGVWHGAGFGFLLWGMLNGLWLWMNRASARFHAAIGMKGRSLIPGPVAVAMMFLAVSFGWIFFRSTTGEGMGTMLQAAFGVHGLSVPSVYETYLGDAAGWLASAGVVFNGPAHVAPGEWVREALPLFAMSAFLIWCTPNASQIFLSAIDGYRVDPVPGFLRWRPSLAGFTAVASSFVLALLFAGTISEFLYFQF